MILDWLLGFEIYFGFGILDLEIIIVTISFSPKIFKGSLSLLFYRLLSSPYLPSRLSARY